MASLIRFTTDGVISGILAARYVADGGHAVGIASGQHAIAGGMSGGHVGAAQGGGGGGYGGGGSSFGGGVVLGGGVALGGGVVLGGGGYGGGGSLYGVEELYPPMPPALTARDVIKPPSPPPEGSMLQQRLMSALALGLGGLMLAGFVMCFYCFFSQVTSPLTGTRSAA
jgi:hypothetical protein